MKKEKCLKSPRVTNSHVDNRINGNTLSIRPAISSCPFKFSAFLASSRRENCGKRPVQLAYNFEKII